MELEQKYIGAIKGFEFDEGFFDSIREKFPASEGIKITKKIDNLNGIYLEVDETYIFGGVIDAKPDKFFSLLFRVSSFGVAELFDVQEIELNEYLEHILDGTYFENEVWNINMMT